MTTTVLGKTITTPLDQSIDETGSVSFSMSFPIEIFGMSLDFFGEKDITVSGDAADGALTVNLKLAACLRGDMDCDDEITSTDAAITLQHAVSGEYDTIADVSGNGRVTSLDALMILQMADR